MRFDSKSLTQCPLRPSVFVASLTVLALACTLFGCTFGQPTQVRRLKSGREIKVMSEMKIFFTGGEPALMLKYQTNLDLTDQAKLHDEVMDIWSEFRSDADRAGVQNAMISAISVPQGGIIKTSQGSSFLFKKTPSGQWQEIERKK